MSSKQITPDQIINKIKQQQENEDQNEIKETQIENDDESSEIDDEEYDKMMREQETKSFMTLMDESFDENNHSTEELIQLYRDGFNYCATSIVETKTMLQLIKEEMDRKQREIELMRLKEQKMEEVIKRLNSVIENDNKIIDQMKDENMKLKLENENLKNKTMNQTQLEEKNDEK